MEDDFKFPTSGMNNEEEVDIDMEGNGNDSPVPPYLKVGEEKEIDKNDLTKKLAKEGEGWETPSSGDEVEGKIMKCECLRFLWFFW